MFKLLLLVGAFYLGFQVFKGTIRQLLKTLQGDWDGKIKGGSSATKQKPWRETDVEEAKFKDVP